MSAFLRDEEVVSAEEIAENGCIIDFKTFIHDYPERIFQLLKGLPLAQAELFIEYYMLEKSQSFLAKCRGQIQARVFESLRMIEQALGALIILGLEHAEIGRAHV